MVEPIIRPSKHTYYTEAIRKDLLQVFQDLLQGFNDPGMTGAEETQKNHEIIYELLQKLTTIRHVNLSVICFVRF